MKLDHVLVASDLSDAARLTYPHAAALAKRTGARVTVLNVDEVGDRASSATGAIAELESYVGMLTSLRQAKIKQAKGDFARYGVHVHFEVVSGVAKRAIARYAEQHRADLIVMAQHSRTGLESLLVGSTVKRVLHLVDVPVMVVPVPSGDAMPSGDPPGIDRYHHVVAPSDLSETSGAGLKFSAWLAGKLGAQLTVVHALDQPLWVPVFAGEGPVPAPPVTSDSTRRGLKDKLAEQALAAGARDAVPTVVDGGPVDGIIEVVRSTGADLVCVPATGKGRLARVFLGSTTERLVKECPAPVLVMPHSFVEQLG